MASSNCILVAVGFDCHKQATAPAVIGEENDVPLAPVIPPPFAATTA